MFDDSTFLKKDLVIVHVIFKLKSICIFFVEFEQKIKSFIVKVFIR